IVEVSIPVRKNHIDREISRYFVDIEVLLNHFPLLIAFGSAKLIDERDQIIMPALRVGFPLVLAGDTAPKPANLEQIAAIIQLVSADEGPIRILDHQVI